jgi:hypothetical protein
MKREGSMVNPRLPSSQRETKEGLWGFLDPNSAIRGVSKEVPSFFTQLLAKSIL